MLIGNLLEGRFELLLFLRDHEQVPDALAPRLFERYARQLLAGPIAPHDTAFAIQDNHQRTHRVEDCGHDVAFFLQLLFGPLQIGDIEGDPMNEPWTAVRMANHLGFAMEPDHPSVAREYPVGGAQRLARKKHLGSFHTPATFIVGMNLLIPLHGIFEPFRLREAQRRFDLRAHIGFADAAVEVCHEHHRRQLLNQGSVFGFQIGELRFRDRPLVKPFEEVMQGAQGFDNVLGVSAGEFRQNCFRGVLSKFFLFGSQRVGIPRRLTAHLPERTHRTIPLLLSGYRFRVRFRIRASL